MQIQDIMSTNVATVSPEDSVEVAARLLSRRNVGMLPVTGPGGRLQGVLTDRDIVLRCVAASFDPNLTKVRQIMSTHPLTLRPGDDTGTASALMAKKQVRRLPVTENGKVVGMVSLSDLALRPDHTMEAAEALADICDNVRRF